MKKSIFELVPKSKDSGSKKHNIKPIEEVYQTLKDVLTTEDISWVWEPPPSMYKGFDKESLKKIKEIAEPLYSTHQIELDVYQRKGRAMSPIRQPQLELHYKNFWIDVVCFPKEFLELSAEEVDQKFQERFWSDDLIQDWRRFHENRGFSYIMHYNEHYIYNKVQKKIRIENEKKGLP